MKLLPCPFCGSERVECSYADAISVEARCNTCGARGPHFALPNRRFREQETLNDIWRGLRRKAARAWNRRTINAKRKR